MASDWEAVNMPRRRQAGPASVCRRKKSVGLNKKAVELWGELKVGRRFNLRYSRSTRSMAFVSHPDGDLLWDTAWQCEALAKAFDAVAVPVGWWGAIAKASRAEGFETPALIFALPPRKAEDKAGG